MTVSRHGGRGRHEASSEASDAHREAARAAREEAERKRKPGPTRQGGDWQARLREGGREAQRLSRPVGRGLHAFLKRIAPPISRGLLAVVRLPVTLLLKLLEGATSAITWIRPRLASAASWFAALVTKHVTPVKTVAAVALVAAAALAVSQFMDYRGVAVGADNYSGEVSTVAPPPLTDVKTAGSAHLFLLVPLALAAAALTIVVARGRSDLARVLCGIGLLGVVVTLAIDLPRGLEAGTSGGAYASSDVEMLDGFWIQLFSSAVIALCGFLLGRYAREESSPPATRRAALPVERSSFDTTRRHDEPPRGGPGGAPPPRQAGA